MAARDELPSPYFSNRNILSVLQDGATALMAAAQEGRTQAAAILVEGGAQVNLQRNVSVWKDNWMSQGHESPWSTHLFSLQNSLPMSALRAGIEHMYCETQVSNPL